MSIVSNLISNQIPVGNIPSGNIPNLSNLQESLNDLSNSYSGGGIMSFFRVIYIIVKYPLKFGLIYYFFLIIIFALKYLYYFLCMAYNRIKKFFKIIINPKSIKIAKFKIYDIFRLFGGVMDLFLGLVFLLVSIGICLAMVVATIPFNMILIW